MKTSIFNTMGARETKLKPPTRVSRARDRETNCINLKRMLSTCSTKKFKTNPDQQCMRARTDSIWNDFSRSKPQACFQPRAGHANPIIRRSARRPHHAAHAKVTHAEHRSKLPLTEPLAAKCRVPANRAPFLRASALRASEQQRAIRRCSA